MARFRLSPVWERVAALRHARSCRAELRRRGSSEEAYRRAASCDPSTAEAVHHLTDYLALDAIERQLARASTRTLRRRMHRRNMLMPQDAACWAPGLGEGRLTPYGVDSVKGQLRQAWRIDLFWLSLLLLSLGTVAISAMASLWPR
jgi:hypothetical protein